MPRDPLADIDRQLAELHQRHIQATNVIAEHLMIIAALESRADVLLDRRADVIAHS